MKEKQIPKVGLAVILMKLNKREVLLGKRKNAYGKGTWSFPGGHLEWFEELANCAKREMFEETGLTFGDNYDLIDTIPITTTNDFFIEEKKHYITLFLRAGYIKGKPQLREPDKCEQWKWYKWKKLPSNLFLPVKNLLQQDYNPFE